MARWDRMTVRGSSDTSWLRGLAGAVVIVAVAATAVACGDGSASSEPDEDPSSTVESSTTTTAPDASDRAQVRPHIQDLLSAWDEDMTAVLEDPEPVAADPDHRLAIEMAESFTDDSPFMSDLDLFLDEVYIDRDMGVRPGPDGLARRTTFRHFTEASADRPDFVSFVFCIHNHGDVFELSTGESAGTDPSVTIAAGDARRVDGYWRLHRLFELGVSSAPDGSEDPCAETAGAQR